MKKLLFIALICSGIKIQSMEDPHYRGVTHQIAAPIAPTQDQKPCIPASSPIKASKELFFRAQDGKIVGMPHSLRAYSLFIENLLQDASLESEEPLKIAFDYEPLLHLAQLSELYDLAEINPVYIKEFLLKKYDNNTPELVAFRNVVDYFEIEILSKICQEIFVDYCGGAKARTVLNRTIKPTVYKSDFITVDPNGRYIEQWKNSSSMKIWDLKQNKCVATSKELDGFIQLTAFSSDGRFIAGKVNGPTIKIWEIQSRTCVNTLQYDDAAFIFYFTFSPDGRSLAIVRRSRGDSSGSQIIIWDRELNTCNELFKSPDTMVECVAYSSDGNFLVAGNDTIIKIFDVKASKCIKELKGHTDSINCAIVSPDGCYIVSGSDDKTIKIWNRESGECLAMLTGHTDAINCLACTLDGRFIISGSDDGTVKIWDVASQNCIETIQNNSSKSLNSDNNYSINSLALSYDNKHLIFSDVKTAKMYALYTPEEIQQESTELVTFTYECSKKNEPTDITVYPHLKELYSQCDSTFYKRMKNYITVGNYTMRKRIASLTGTFLGAGTGFMLLKNLLPQAQSWRLPLLGLGAALGGIAGYNLGSCLNNVHYILRHED